MSTTNATPPATRRIARSYLTDLVAARILHDDGVANPPAVAAVVDQLLDRALNVRTTQRSEKLVLTFDLADDPAGWSTPKPAAAEAHATAAGEGDPWTAPIAGNVEVRDQ